MRDLDCWPVASRVVIAGTMLILSACGSDYTDTSAQSGSTPSGSVTLGITDAPVDNAEEVVVQFNGVEFVPAGEDGDNTGDGSNFEAIMFDEPRTMDLLALQGSTRDFLLDGEELPVGEYGQIRLLVQAENDGIMDSYIMVNGGQHELRIPSGSQTGLKLVHNFDVESEGEIDFTIDFDLRKSVVFAPGPGYMLKPVLRLVETDNTGEITGTLDPAAVFSGQGCSDVLPVEASYGVYLYEGSGVTPDDLAGSETEPLTTTGVEELTDSSNYSYSIGFLDEGEYTIAATCQADRDDPELNDDIQFTAATDITVTAGAATTHNFQ